MTKIPLSNSDQFALVDDWNVEKVSGYNWFHFNGYAYANAKVPTGGYMSVTMHTLIRDCPCGQGVDHIDNNGLNNLEANLRCATKGQNQIRTGPRNGRKYVGVRRRSKYGYWARTKVNGKEVVRGPFLTEEAAARARDALAKEHFGEFAYLNFPENDPKGSGVNEDTPNNAPQQIERKQT